MKLVYDPPKGWAYGFPKEVPEEVLNTPKGSGAFRQWILDEGYPEEDVDFAMKYGRSWYEETEDEEK